MATTTTADSERSNRDEEPQGSIRSLIPARLDRLGWSRFHTRLVIALGVAWVLDGLEITIASNVTKPHQREAGASTSRRRRSRFAVGTVYLLGEVAGALFFGRLSDKWGRRNLFMITLGVYLFGGALTRAHLRAHPGWVYWLWASRFIAGMGIGGEYAAINSAIDELIPARYRGRVDIAVNGTYWGGALLATVLILLVVNHLPVTYSWRVAFLLGPALGFVVLFVRRNLPESPRWLLMHGRVEEAEAAVAEIERHAEHRGRSLERRRRVQGHRDHARRQHRLHRLGQDAVRRRTRSGPSSARPDDHPVVPLQRHLLHLRPGAHQGLRGAATDRPPYYFMFFAAGNLLGPLTDRPALRHDRAQEDDRRHLLPLRRPAGRQRRPVQGRGPRRRRPRRSAGA